MNGRVEGKVAFVTGAARGQGRSHAIRLAEEGADIIALDLCEAVGDFGYPGATPADLEETVAAVQALGRRIVAATGDVRDLAVVEQALRDGVAQLGRLDIVSANAGIAPVPSDGHSITPDAWQEVIDINLTGVWHTCRAAVPHLLAGGRGGAMVLTSSSLAQRAQPNMSHYIAAKTGLLGMMRGLAHELGPHSIRVNSILPGVVDTPMIDNDSIIRAFRPDLPNPTKEDFAEMTRAGHLMPVPWVEARDISNALLFLVSDEARYITGVPLPVDAGTVLT